MKFEYAIISGSEADVFGKINVTELVLALADENCRVLSIREHDESLENYYINLIGGMKNE